jgi:hypothetical protein
MQNVFFCAVPPIFGVSFWFLNIVELIGCCLCWDIYSAQRHSALLRCHIQALYGKCRGAMAPALPVKLIVNLRKLVSYTRQSFITLASEFLTKVIGDCSTRRKMIKTMAFAIFAFCDLFRNILLKHTISKKRMKATKETRDQSYKSFFCSKLTQYFLS